MSSTATTSPASGVTPAQGAKFAPLVQQFLDYLKLERHELSVSA